MRARITVAALAVSIATLLSGCVGAPDAGAGPATPAPEGAGPTTPAPDATELVGVWRVSGIAGDIDSWLVLDARRLELWRACGRVSGEWAAGEGAFVAGTYGWSGSCTGDRNLPSIDWLVAVAGYDREGSGWLLTSSDGAALARLATEESPPAGLDWSGTSSADSDVRKHFDIVAPSIDVVPVSSAELVGRWVPPETYATEPWLEVAADGTWTASDGCNGMQGRWATPRAGALLSTGGPMTLMGCEGSSAPMAFALARTVGFDGDRLVLFDPSGIEIARLVAG